MTFLNVGALKAIYLIKNPKELLKIIFRMTENKIATANIVSDVAISSLKEEFLFYQTTLSENTSEKGLNKAIIEHFSNICESYLHLAESALENNLNKVEQTSTTSYLLHFRLSEFFKDLLLLHRDVSLQLNIGKHKMLEGVVSEEIFKKHVSESYKVLLEATNFFIGKLKEEEVMAARVSQKKDSL